MMNQLMESVTNSGGGIRNLISSSFPLKNILLRDLGVGYEPILVFLFISVLPIIFRTLKMILWFTLGLNYTGYQKNSKCEVVRTITGSFSRSHSRYRYCEYAVNDHNGILLNAVLMYIANRTGISVNYQNLDKEEEYDNLWSESDWGNKPSVLFLFDPLKSDSRSILGPTSFKYPDNFIKDVKQRIYSERNQLQRYTIIRLPTAGSWLPIDDGIEVTYQRQRADSNDVNKVNHTLYLKTRRENGYQLLEEFVQKCLNRFLANLTKTKKIEQLHFQLQNNGFELKFQKTILSSTRTFNSLFFPQKKEFLDLLDQFLEKRGRFAVEGFPDRIGILLYGPQGTGKTSFVAALSAYTGRHIISIYIPIISTNSELYDIFLNQTLPCVGGDDIFKFDFSDVIFLLDNVDPKDKLLRERFTVDKQIIKKKKELQSDSFLCSKLDNLITRAGDAVNLSGLLNVLDGVVDTPSRIVVMTTRDPAGIDPALLRPGRFGIKLHMQYMRLPELIELLGLFFGEDVTNNNNTQGKLEYKSVITWCEDNIKTKGIRRLSEDDEKRVRQCIELLGSKNFSISPAVAESMCLATTSLDKFLDELKRSHNVG